MADGTIITSITDALAVCTSMVESTNNEVVYISPPSLLILGSQFGLHEKIKTLVQKGGRRGALLTSRTSILARCESFWILTRTCDTSPSTKRTYDCGGHDARRSSASLRMWYIPGWKTLLILKGLGGSKQFQHYRCIAFWECAHAAGRREKKLFT